MPRPVPTRPHHPPAQRRLRETPRRRGVRLDAGLTDSDVTDAGLTDSGATDSGATDSGATDSGVTDSGATDSGVTDSDTHRGVDPDLADFRGRPGIHERPRIGLCRAGLGPVHRRGVVGARDRRDEREQQHEQVPSKGGLGHDAR
ncbi:MAG: hypothetical protein KF773_41110 [Deltaproteobacteria bacterium]|nr:hypothetical protein [Deltaproteobacteria bacterium]